VKQAPDDDRMARARQARQVISGSDIRPPAYSSTSFLADDGWLTPPQKTYLIACGVLLFVALIVTFFFSFGAASVIFFLLALVLLAGWLIF
jgi:Flp pilus assembly protein TadB